MAQLSYRPLTGELFPISQIFYYGLGGYRPLAGMNCFLGYSEKEIRAFALPSPRGDELFPIFRGLPGWLSRYRPLAGMNCFIFNKGIDTMKKVTVPSRG